MGGILTSFVTIGLPITAGFLAPRLGVVTADVQAALVRLSYFLAAPALIFMVVARSDLSLVFHSSLLIQLAATGASAAIFLLINRFWLKLRGSTVTVAVCSSSYINAINIGIPIAIYVLDDPAATIPLILFQVLVIAPAVIVTLDRQTHASVSWRFIALQPIRNPIILGTAAGAVVSLTGWAMPSFVYAPLNLLGGGAIPMQLLAFGMSLHGVKLFSDRQATRVALVSAGLKSVGMPLCALFLARFVFAVDSSMFLSAAVLAALPTAQNVYNYSARFNAGHIIARESIVLTTLATPLVLLGLTAWLA